MGRIKLTLSTVLAIALSIAASAVAFADSTGPWHPK
jgi:hypothetical protein